MHHNRELSAEDREALKRVRKSGFTEIGTAVVILYLVMPALFYFFGDFGPQAMLIYFGICTLLMAGLGLAARYVFNTIDRDLRGGVKLTGVTQLTSKSEVLTKSGRRHFFFQFDLDGPREVDVEQGVYHQHPEGTLIYIELACHCRQVLRVEPAPESPYRGK